MGFSRGFIRSAAAVGLAAGLISGGVPIRGLIAGVTLARGPDSLADLVDSVVDAVVNISASQTVEDQVGPGLPGLPPDSPFNDLFDEFFKRQNPGGKPNENAPHHKTSSLGSGFIIDPA